MLSLWMFRAFSSNNLLAQANPHPTYRIIRKRRSKPSTQVEIMAALLENSDPLEHLDDLSMEIAGTLS